MSKFKIKKYNLKFCGFFLIAVFLFSLNVNSFLRDYFNTFDGKNWNVAKDRLSHFVMGSHSFRYSHYIVNNRLELSNFFGFNEIELKDTENEFLYFDKASFNLNLNEKNGYLYFIFKKTDEGCYALRLSNSKEKNNCFLEFTPLMEKTRKADINYPPLDRDRWYKIEVEFFPAYFNLYINGSRIARIENNNSARGKLGFRCGHARVLIDDVEVSGAGYYFRDSFEPRANKAYIYIISLLAGVVSHILLFLIVFYLSKVFFNLDIDKSVSLFIFILKFLIPAALFTLVSQAISPGWRFNNFYLFYFGRMNLPSLRFLYGYIFIFIVIFLYKTINLPALNYSDRRFPKTILLASLFLLSFFFFYNGRSLNIARVENTHDKSINKKLMEKRNILLKYPMKINQPYLERDYVLYLCFKLEGPSSKLLAILDGNKFIISDGYEAFSGFEAPASPNDFSFKYTRPKNRLYIEKDRYYLLKIIKDRFSLRAYINGKFIDERYCNEETQTYKFLRGTVYLFPINDTPLIKTLIIKQTTGRKVYFDMIKLKRMARSISYMAFFLFLYLCCVPAKTGSGLSDFIHYSQFLILPAPFLILYYQFDSLLFNDKVFYFILYFAYILIIAFLMYKKLKRI